MLNEPLMIMVLGTGLLVGAGRVRSWRQSVPASESEPEAALAREEALGRSENLNVEAGADLV